MFSSIPLCVTRKFSPQSFSSGLQFEYLTKTLLAKLSCKDWTPLDRNFIRTRVALLGGWLAHACHRGALPPLEGVAAEGGDQAGVEGLRPLTDVDTQVRRAFN